MKTTFDLPEPLMRRAKAAAAHQGRPLRDLVAEAIEAKLAAEEAAAGTRASQDNPWKAFMARLQKLPDGTYYNPEGIEDDAFFRTLDTIRADKHAWEPRDPFAPQSMPSDAPAETPRKRKRA